MGFDSMEAREEICCFGAKIGKRRRAERQKRMAISRPVPCIDPGAQLEAVTMYDDRERLFHTEVLAVQDDDAIL
jgi:hypothetical protein